MSKLYTKKRKPGDFGPMVSEALKIPGARYVYQPPEPTDPPAPKSHMTGAELASFFCDSPQESEDEWTV